MDLSANRSSVGWVPDEDTDCWVDPCVQQTEANWISLDEELVLSTSLLQIATKVLLEVDYHRMI